MIKYSHAM
jgi:hypothetical protein